MHVIYILYMHYISKKIPPILDNLHECFAKLTLKLVHEQNDLYYYYHLIRTQISSIGENQNNLFTLCSFCMHRT